jgi:excisionase family DNA binding protein
MPTKADENDPPQPEADPGILATPTEVAKMLRVPTTWVYSHQNEIPGLLRLGRYVRFRRTAIERFLQSK